MKKVPYIVMLLVAASCSSYPDIDFIEHMEKNTDLVFSKQKYSDSIQMFYATLNPGDVAYDSTSFDKVLSAAKSFFNVREKMVSEGLQSYYCFDTDGRHCIFWAMLNDNGSTVYTFLFSEYPMHELKPDRQ